MTSPYTASALLESFAELHWFLERQERSDDNDDDSSEVPMFPEDDDDEEHDEDESPDDDFEDEDDDDDTFDAQSGDLRGVGTEPFQTSSQSHDLLQLTHNIIQRYSPVLNPIRPTEHVGRSGAGG